MVYALIVTMNKVDDFISHEKTTVMTIGDGENFVPILDITASLRDIRKIKSSRSYSHHHSHIRIGSIYVEFFHDGFSLDRVKLPEIDNLAPDWEKELILRDWLTWVPKRVIEVQKIVDNVEQPFGAPLEFIYTQKGLINEINLIESRAKEYIVLKNDSLLGFKCYGGLQGSEKLICHCEWDEYLSIYTR